MVLPNLAYIQASGIMAKAPKAPGLLSPLTLGFSAVGAALGYYNASVRNAAVADAADRQQELIDEQLTRVNTKWIKDTSFASRSAQQELGRVTNAMAALGSSGQSVREAVVMETAAIAAENQSSLNAGRRYAFADAALQKEQVVAQANSQMLSPVLAAISGGAQGFQQGMAFDTALANNAAAKIEAANSRKETIIALTAASMAKDLTKQEAAAYSGRHAFEMASSELLGLSLEGVAKTYDAAREFLMRSAVQVAREQQLLTGEYGVFFLPKLQ